MKKNTFRVSQCNGCKHLRMHGVCRCVIDKKAPKLLNTYVEPPHEGYERGFIHVIKPETCTLEREKNPSFELEA